MTRVAFAIVAALAAARVAAQECAPHEVPLRPDRLEEERCNALNVPCQQRNARRRAEFSASRQTFDAPLAPRFGDETREETWQTTLVGCAGAIVAVEASGTNLFSVSLTLLAPSGAMVLSVSHHFWGSDAVHRWAAVEVPESGTYVLRVTTDASASDRQERCRSDGLSALTSLLSCRQKEWVYVWPRALQLRFVGTAGLQPLAVGDEWNASLATDGTPVSRRLRLPPDAPTPITVSAAARVPILARWRIPATGQRGEVKLPTGSGTVDIAPAREEQELVLRLDRDDRYAETRAPLAVRVALGTGAVASAGPAAAPAAMQPLGVDVPEQTGTILATPGRNRVAFRVVPAVSGDHAVVVVPSARAGLVVRVSVFDEQTEELLAREDGVAERTVLPVRARAGTPFHIEIEAERIAAPGPDGTARYTVGVQRLRSAPRPAPAAPGRRPPR